MNNIAKFERSKKALEEFKQKTSCLEEEVEKKEETKGIWSKATEKALLKFLATQQLSINYKRALVTFESISLGQYVQPMFVKKRRLNVVALCFLFQMYKDEIRKAGIKEAETIDIPFELRGFWKIEKAIDFIEDLEKLQRESIRTIQRQIGYNKKNEEVIIRLTKISSLIESIEIQSPKSGRMQVCIKDKQEVFNVNMKNTKLDIVPLCKIVTSYYVELLAVIQEYAESGLNKCGEKYKLDEIAEKFRSLMERYFTIQIMR